MGTRARADYLLLRDFANFGVFRRWSLPHPLFSRDVPCSNRNVHSWALYVLLTLHDVNFLWLDLCVHCQEDETDAVIIQPQPISSFMNGSLVISSRAMITTILFGLYLPTWKDQSRWIWMPFIVEHRKGHVIKLRLKIWIELMTFLSAPLPVSSLHKHSLPRRHTLSLWYHYRVFDSYWWSHFRPQFFVHSNEIMWVCPFRHQPKVCCLEGLLYKVHQWGNFKDTELKLKWLASISKKTSAHHLTSVTQLNGILKKEFFPNNYPCIFLLPAKPRWKFLYLHELLLKLRIK